MKEKERKKGLEGDIPKLCIQNVTMRKYFGLLLQKCAPTKNNSNRV